MRAGHIIGVDVGGTFTDVVSVDEGRIRTTKVATNPRSSDKSVLEGAAEVGVETAAVLNLATTAGLNAVITRRLPKIAFLTTTGHRDMLDRGTIYRPMEAMTDYRWRRPFGDAMNPLVPRYLRRGIDERVTAAGDVLIPLDENNAREQLRVLKGCCVQGVAICLINSYRNGVHERRLRELVAEELGDIACSLSSEVSPLAKEYTRASTTVIDLLMKLMYGEYTNRLEIGLDALGFDGHLNFADCRAQLLSADFAMERPYQLVMGGPAGGTVSSAHFGRAIGDGNLLCADVGGTSCDISVVIDGEPWAKATFELEHDLIVNAPSINVITLGAGGGSVVRVTQSGDIATGPDSAGAEPGPACYGAGGLRPTITDAALLMGILAPDRFLGGRKLLHPDFARDAFERLQTRLPVADRIRFGWGMALANIAEGLLDISIRRGIDPREFSLIAFGAAGPMLLPCLLDQFRMRRVIVPPHPGLFSALGLVSSDRAYSDHRGGYMLLKPENADALNALYDRIEEQLLARLGPEGAKAKVVRSFDARLLGQSWELPFTPVPPGPITRASIATMIASFHEQYAKLNGHRFDALPVQSVIYRVQAVAESEKLDYAPAPRREGPLRFRETPIRYLYEEETTAREYERDDLQAGDVLQGPAIIRESLSTSFVPLWRRATVGAFGELVIE